MRSVLTYKGIIVVAILMIAISDSFMLFAQNSCTQNNIYATGYELRDEFGQAFTATDDYELGDPISGELWVNLSGSSSNGYNMRMFYDLYVNGNPTAPDQQDCLFSGTGITLNTWMKARDFNWIWGDVIEITNIFIDWTTGSAKPATTCNFDLAEDPQKTSQCYSNPTGFTAAVPLFPKFDFVSDGICNTSLDFSSLTIGGSPPFNYTFEWDFDGLGTATGSNVSFDFPGTGTYTIGLTANDGVSTTTIQKDIVIDPNFGIIVDLFPTKQNESTGIIYTTVSGGTEPYTYLWTGPNGFTSTSRDIFNLSDGDYNLAITDANGCQQTETYTLDIANVLGFNWTKFELQDQESRIKINWEVTNEKENTIYEIERSNGNINEFSLIGSVKGQNTGSASSKYSFSDNSYASHEDIFYYRIAKKSNSSVDYSPVKMIRKGISLKTKSSWFVFPNPSTDGKISIKYLENEKPTVIQLELFSASQFSRSKELTLDQSGIIDLQDVFKSIPIGMSILKITWDSQTETVKLIRSN